MSEQAQTQNLTDEQKEAIQAFNESVNTAVLRNFEFNSQLMASGISGTGVALANGLSAADLTAAIAVENGNGPDVIDVLLTNLLDDMKKRALAAYEFYSQQKAEREANEAAANDATVGA
jgi:predicted transglutaminase-like cysteine proteinase